MRASHGNSLKPVYRFGAAALHPLPKVWCSRYCVCENNTFAGTHLEG